LYAKGGAVAVVGQVTASLYVIASVVAVVFADTMAGTTAPVTASVCVPSYKPLLVADTDTTPLVVGAV
jgi:hypothetical protein